MIENKTTLNKNIEWKKKSCPNSQMVNKSESLIKSHAAKGRGWGVSLRREIGHLAHEAEI